MFEFPETYSKFLLAIYFTYRDSKQARPRRATPRLRSGAEAGRTPCPRGDGQEELHHIRGQGKCPRVPGRDHAGTAQRSYPTSEVGAAARVSGCDSAGAAKRRYPTSEVWGCGWEELPAAWRQWLWPGGATPCPGSHGCASTGGPWGTTPYQRSGGMVVRRYLSSKVRSSGCALLEQPCRDTPRPR